MVPIVFMDYDLLEAIAKNYDQALRVVRRADGEILITVSPKESREIFSLGPITDYHVPIDLRGLENEYMSKRDAIRKGALRARIGKIGTLPTITSSSREPFKRVYFNSRAIEVYRSLCRVFERDEEEFVLVDFMYMIIQISSFGVNIVFYFASYLAEEIHNGLGLLRARWNKLLAIISF